VCTYFYFVNRLLHIYYRRYRYASRGAHSAALNGRSPLYASYLPSEDGRTDRNDKKYSAH